MTSRIFIALLLILFSIPQSGQAANTRRIALVIGNGSYRAKPLANPVHDADDMAAALGRLGFKTTRLVDVDRRRMLEAIHSFGDRLRKAGGVGLFYYAGHAVQVNGRNYLLPIGLDIRSSSDVEFEAVDLSRILGKMNDAGTDVNILILDACRDNPFSAELRSIRGGLAQVSAPRGTFIAFATAPGMTAADGSGRNGVFTGAILKHIRTPGLTIEQVMNKVRLDTAIATDKKQIPWTSSSMMGSFFFLPATEPVHTIPSQPEPPSHPADGKPEVIAATTKPDKPKRSSGKAIARKDSYIRYSNGTVVDTDMGLAWTQKPVGIMSWLKAQRRIRQINQQGLMGYHNWRLPNKGELLRLARFARKHRAFFSGDDWWHWSATRGGPLTAWRVKLGAVGAAFDDFDESAKKTDFEEPYAIRLVRSLPIENE